MLLNINKRTFKDFTIGADPEFSCVDSSRAVVSAKEYLGNKGYSGPEGSLGADGCATTFEIRPKEHQHPLGIVNNLQSIFKKQVEKIPKFDKLEWQAGSFQNKLSLGGHIHFGIPQNGSNYSDLVNLLDNYLGPIGLLLEEKQQAIDRRRNNYGLMSDKREQSWGMEYRVLSSWLTSPYISAGMLCLAKAIAFEYINNPKFKWSNYVNSDTFKTVNVADLRVKFPNMWKEISRMNLYQIYKPNLDLIYYLIKNNYTWFPNTTMKQAWGIGRIVKPINIPQVKFENIWARYIAQNPQNA